MDKCVHSKLTLFSRDTQTQMHKHICTNTDIDTHMHIHSYIRTHGLSDFLQNHFLFLFGSMTPTHFSTSWWSSTGLTSAVNLMSEEDSRHQ